MGLRKRATIIVKTSKGILLVSHSRRKPPTFMLPGGGVRGREHSMSAAIRELYEETGLHSKQARFLFSFKGRYHNHRVFLIKTWGRLRKRHETRHIAFWNKNTKNKLKVSGHVIPILKRYYKK